MPFRDVPKNEDYWFVNDHRPRIRRVCAAEYYILVRHGRNTWQFRSGERVDSYFQSLPPYPKALDALVPPEDIEFYRSLQSRHPRGQAKEDNMATPLKTE